MTIHSIRQYLRHRMHAMGRHGMHSPFVYAFIERVIQDRPRRFRNVPVAGQLQWLGQPYAGIVSRMIEVYDYAEVVTAPENEVATAGKRVLFLLPATRTEHWMTDMEGGLRLLGGDGAVAVQGIHRTSKHSDLWDEMCRHHAVRLSLDIYDIGLLFFNNDFREKQHFALKSR